MSWESERMSQVRSTYEAWQRETEDLKTKLKIAEQQRDEVNIRKIEIVRVLINIFKGYQSSKIITTRSRFITRFTLSSWIT